MVRVNFKYAALTCLLSLLASCSYNPFVPPTNQLDGDPLGAAVGAGVGVGAAAAVDAPKWVLPITGLAGGFLGYYFTTLRFDASGLYRGGGKVYQVGDFVGIYIPTDRLFEPNTDEFLPRAKHILQSAVAILQRNPHNNIFVSGNSSGFFRSKWEQRLSERRAKRVSAFLWDSGINNFNPSTTETKDMRNFTYVGYGDYFPIANDITNKGIRENSRIQITSFPVDCDLFTDARSRALEDPGALQESAGLDAMFCEDCKPMDPPV